MLFTYLLFHYQQKQCVDLWEENLPYLLTYEGLTAASLFSVLGNNMEYITSQCRSCPHNKECVRELPLLNRDWVYVATKYSIIIA